MNTETPVSGNIRFTPLEIYLIGVVKKAYLKHVIMSDDIGWEELSDCLCDALCESLGDRQFCNWVSSINKR